MIIKEKVITTTTSRIGAQTATMSIATSIETASIGADILTLSSTAVANAAIAWLRGAFAAGGGMAIGSVV